MKRRRPTASKHLHWSSSSTSLWRFSCSTTRIRYASFGGIVLLLCFQAYQLSQVHRLGGPSSSSSNHHNDQNHYWLSYDDLEALLIADSVVHNHVNDSAVLADYLFGTSADFPFMEVDASPPEHRFPRWNATTGISFPDLVDFMDGVVNGTASTNRWPTQRERFPEIPYIFDMQDVWVSRTVRDRSWKKMWKYRVLPTESILRLARTILIDADPVRWPHVYEAVIYGAGLPLLIWYGDHRGCNHNNVRRGPHFDRTIKGRSVPLFTTCGNIHCNYSFPLPTYKTISDARSDRQAWDILLWNRSQAYPSDQKIPQAVWRGSLSHAIPDGQYRTTLRWRLARLSHTQDMRARHQWWSMRWTPSLLNAGLVSIPDKHQRLRPDTTEIGGLKDFIRPSENFQKYAAILDVDGNSWSSRFGTLLCYDSIVLKVKPQYVDLFMRDLVPGKHYISIEEDLSDLLPKLRFLLDPANEEYVDNVKEAAHQYCRRRMVWSRLAEDVLDVLDEYARYLFLADPHWEDDWVRVKERMLSPLRQEKDVSYQFGSAPFYQSYLMRPEDE